MATLEEYLFSKSTKWGLWGVLAAFVGLLIFLAGISVGERHSMHEANEMGAQRPFGLPLPNGYIIKGHGAAGTITSISSSSIELRERDGDTAMVFLSSSTPVSGPALAPGEFIVVIGDPASQGGEDGVNARFVRVLPAPPDATTTKGAVFYKSF